MTALLVEAPALTSYAGQIDRARDDARLVSEYVVKHATNGTGGELFALAQEGNQHAVEVIRGTFTRLTCVLEYSAPELRSAAGYYQATDFAAATNLDRNLPPGMKTCPTPLEYEIASNACKPPLFGDSRVPESHLRPPPDEVDGPSNKLGFTDYISPTAWIMKGFDVVLGFDPIQEVQNKLFGDWEILGRMPAVLTNASAAMHDLSINVQSGASSLQGYWQGNAGDTAYRYFTDLATSINGLSAPLVTMGEEYRTMSNAVWEAGDAIGGLIKGMCDAALIAGMAAIGGTATAATGVGAAVGYGLAAVETAIILKHWADVTKYLAYANSAIMGFRAVLDRGLSDLDSISLPVIGGGAGYDHPLTGAGAHA